MYSKQANLEDVKVPALEKEDKRQPFKRRRFMVNPSVQGLYIAFSIIPAVLATIFCTYAMMHSGETVLRSAKEAPLVPIHTMAKVIETLEEGAAADKSASEINWLKTQMENLKLFLESSYHDTLKQWNVIRLQIIMVMFWSIILIGCLALLFSHRVAGPLYRLQKCIDQFASGQDTGPIRLRKKDHYKGLAASIENLRQDLVERGVLQRKENM